MELTQAEKKALIAYLRNPSSDPKELAGSMEMSYWTLMKSKKRLMEKGIMRFIWVPDIKRAGAEIIFSGYGAVKRDEKAPQVSSDLLFFVAEEERKGFGIGLAPDYTSLYDEFMEFSERYGNLRAESFGLGMLPLSRCDVWRFADFYPLLSQDFGMHVPEIPEKTHSGDFSLKKDEKEVYISIVQHPEWSGERIGRELGISRQRVLRLRERFESEGLLRKKAIVDLKKMGYEMLLFATWTMRPGIYRKMYENINRYPLNPVILGISTPMHGMVMAAFRSFRKSREILERLSAWSNPEENLIGEPDVLFLSLQDSVFPRYFDFSHVVRILLK